MPSTGFQIALNFSSSSSAIKSRSGSWSGGGADIRLRLAGVKPNSDARFSAARSTGTLIRSAGGSDFSFDARLPSAPGHKGSGRLFLFKMPRASSGIWVAQAHLCGPWSPRCAPQRIRPQLDAAKSREALRRLMGLAGARTTKSQTCETCAKRDGPQASREERTFWDAPSVSK